MWSKVAPQETTVQCDPSSGMWTFSADLLVLQILGWYIKEDVCMGMSYERKHVIQIRTAKKGELCRIVSTDCLTFVRIGQNSVGVCLTLPVLEMKSPILSIMPLAFKCRFFALFSLCLLWWHFPLYSFFWSDHMNTMSKKLCTICPRLPGRKL